MPPHRVYIEPFLGSGAILRMKRPAEINIGIDADSRAIALFSGNGDRSEVFCADALKYLASVRKLRGDELIYCDPPYMHETRVDLDRYKFEMNDQQHRRLLQIIKGLPCMVMISGYYSDLYVRKLKNWNHITFQAVTRAGTMATEWLWFNFPPPLALHDYRYLGADYRERERIKRKTLRWQKRIQRMPTLERHALMHALELASS